jgi:hypothetical protein
MQAMFNQSGNKSVIMLEGDLTLHAGLRDATERDLPDIGERGGKQ